jgi:hypothetical protein
MLRLSRLADDAQGMVEELLATGTRRARRQPADVETRPPSARLRRFEG